MPLTGLEETLRPIARERIAKGILPCEVSTQIWGGKGSGKLCSLCDEPITANHVEYEIELPDAKYGKRTWRFHILCQSIWQLECVRYDHLKRHPPAPA